MCARYYSCPISPFEVSSVVPDLQQFLSTAGVINDLKCIIQCVWVPCLKFFEVLIQVVLNFGSVRHGFMEYVQLLQHR